MKNKIKLLPDGGLPIEQEVERNVDNFIREVSPNLEQLLEQKNLSVTIRRLIHVAIRRVIFSKLGDIFREEINEQRAG